MPKCYINNHYALRHRISQSSRQCPHLNYNTLSSLFTTTLQNRGSEIFFAHARVFGLGSFHGFTMMLLETIYCATFARGKTRVVLWRAAGIKMTRSFSFIASGFSNRKHALEYFKQHEDSKCHKTALTYECVVPKCGDAFAMVYEKANHSHGAESSPFSANSTKYSVS